MCRATPCSSGKGNNLIFLCWKLCKETTDIKILIFNFSRGRGPPWRGKLNIHFLEYYGMKLTTIKYLVDLYQVGGGLHEVTHNPQEENWIFIFWQVIKWNQWKENIQLTFIRGGGLDEVTHNSPITNIEYSIFGKLINENNEI